MPTEERTSLINAEAYGLRPDDNTDATPALKSALEALPDGGTLRLAPGKYDFWSDSAPERYLNLSNNCAGWKRIAFLLENRRKITVEGSGAHLVFHGEILPFVIDGGCDIALVNLTIDWIRPFYSQGEILDGSPSHVDVQIDHNTYPCEVRDNRLFFLGDGWAKPLIEGIMEVEPDTGRPAVGSGDNLGGSLSNSHGVLSLANGTYRLKGDFGHSPRPGNHLILRHTERNFPAVFAKNSRNLNLRKLRIRHSAGTAILTQFCENVALRDCEVRPDKESGRLFSASGDACHCVNCCGQISLDGCYFANQLDDAVNIHGIHYFVTAVEGPRRLRLARVHFQQHGVSCGFSGDEVHFRDQQSMCPSRRNRIASVEVIDDEFLLVDFENDHGLSAGNRHVMENLRWTPQISIRNCDFRDNRARGILVSSPRRTQITGNFLSSAGASVKISGDANYWFESGSVTDVCIEGNVFADGNYGPRQWGRAAIDIDPEIVNPWLAPEPFHRNITIIANIFQTSHTGLLYARSVDGISFLDNRVENGEPLNRIHQLAARLTYDACRNIEVVDNVIAEDAPAADTMKEINDMPTNRHHVTPQPHLEDPGKTDSE